MTFEAEELYKYIRERMARFLVVNVIELLPHLPCLTQMDQERIRAQVKMEGNEAVVPLLLDSVRRRRNWERQLINALKNTEFEDLANDLETKLVSLAPRSHSASGGFKLPVQEMGNPLNSEESKDFKMPMQEKMGPSDLPKSCDSSQLQKNQTQHSNRDKSPQKHNTPSSDQATDQAIAIVPPPSMQVHPVRPSHESSGNWVPTTDKPGALCDAENMESANESTGNLPEGCYSITSSDLQFSESTSSATGNDGCDPVSKPEHDGVLDGFSDENSLKEQKIRALQGYQNDQLQEDFYDVNSPMNIQLNVDALKKLTDTRESSGLGQEETLKQNFKELHRKSKLNPISGTENAQSPALRSSHPVDDGVDSELEFKRNVQPYNSNVSISREELALRSGFSDVSFQKDSLVTNNETSASATNVNARTQDQSLKHDNKPEHVREVNFNPSHPVKCTKEGSDKESSQKVDLSKGDSFQLHNEVNHGECYFNSEENQTGLYNEDVKEFCGDIHQEPEYENEADKDREFKTGNLGDFSRCYSEDGLIDALSNKHMSFASREKSQTNLPEKSIWDLRQADYVLVSTIFFAITIFAGLVWKRYHK
ncbi:mitochondrial antiviral-signaling protein isoform X2 [Narcine bancroftii]|uniref:mitochondrial antiviral-signaling protein isoform X2 n=1 Tax=Narcine bancroftii TaxID=1343680 RepID=UPI0038314D77